LLQSDTDESKPDTPDAFSKPAAPDDFFKPDTPDAFSKPAPDAPSKPDVPDAFSKSVANAFCKLSTAPCPDQSTPYLTSPSTQTHSQHSPGTSQKRSHSSVSDLSSDESDSKEGRFLARRRGHPHHISSSWSFQKSKRDTCRQSKVSPKYSRLIRFRNKIQVDDPHAEFEKSNPLLVRCSACSEWITMRTHYDVRRWKDHRATRKCRKNTMSGLSTPSLLSLGFKKAIVPSLACGTHPVPCPGLSRSSDCRIDKYMSRSSALGGGAPSRHVIAQELLGISEVQWRDLDKQQQEMVQRREENLYRWRIS
jgi:hypothetical protein